MIRLVREAIARWVAPWTERELADEWADIAAEWRRVAEAHRKVSEAASRVQELGRTVLEEAAAADDLRSRA